MKKSQRQGWNKNRLKCVEPAPASLATVSRQVTRRELVADAITAVNRRNLVQVGGLREHSHYRGMPRRERRALAKAYAASAWRELRLKRAKAVAA